MVDKRGRLYIPVDPDSEYFDEDLGEWLASKIPPVPKGQVCEANRCAIARTPATSYSYRIEGDHVCYAYICDDCQERCDPDYLVDNDYPTTSGGYAVVPTHCS